MLRRTLALLVVPCLIAACTDLPPSDNGGGGGGSGGTAGIGGTGGTSGAGGAGATGMDPCSEIVLNAADEMKNSNSLGGGVAVGTVCSISGASCDDDTDVQHVWSMQALCAGLHAIALTWTDDTMANDLDLALYDQDGEEPVEPNRPSDTKEDIEIVLGVTETYTIEVRATDTAGQRRVYTLTVDYLP